MKSVVFAAFAVMAVISAPAMAGEVTTKTPEAALPEPENVTAQLPRSTMADEAPLALPEAEATAPYRHCHERDTVYLTN